MTPPGEIGYTEGTKTFKEVSVGEPEKDYLTAGQAAARLHVSSKTLSRHRAEGKLADIRKIRSLGGHWRYHAGDINALAARLAEPVEEAS